MRPTLSLVLPVFNEESVLPELDRRLVSFMGQLGVSCEIVFVNDGSSDGSLAILRDLAAKNPAYRVLALSRNFGHQIAITAGLDHAEGEAVVVMDADLQDPPEVVLEMVRKWKEGYDVVYATRRSRAGETWFKLLTAKLFYRFFAAMVPIRMPLDTGDFRLMSRKVVLALSSLRESHRFVRGLVAWLGFRQTSVHYDRPERFAGETKYPLRKMIRFALDGIASFSTLPLRFAMWLGVIVGFLSLGYASWAVIAKYVYHSNVQGWTAVVVLIALLASVQLFVTGILGEYVGRVYEEVKGRPLYLLDTQEGDGATRPDGSSKLARLRKKRSKRR